MSPATAEVIISLPSLSLSGIPAEVVTIKTPYSIRTRASPPPRPTAILMMEAKKLLLPSALVLIQPMAVSISSVPHEDA